MTKGDILNWGCAVFAIVLLYMACFVAFVPRSVAPDKYYYAMLWYASGFHAAILCLVVTGAFSLIARNSTPIIGALCGLGGVLVLGIASLVAFVAIVFIGYFIAPNANGRPIMLALSAIVMAFPITALAMAFLRQPKTKSSNKALEDTSLRADPHG